MTVRARAAAARPHPALAWLVVACGLAALVVRVKLVGAPGAATLFAALLAGLAVVSAITPVPTGASPGLRAAPVAIAGAVVVVSASLALGRGVPLPHGALALALGVGAALSEELFFRRLVYGALVAWHPAVAVVGSALVFALVHVPLYGRAVVWVNLGAGLLFAWQRWATGDVRASAATHALANLLAVLR
jgi:membrane protease YdiL (CAAX protease family)